MTQTADQIQVLNQNVTRLGRDIALLQKGFVVRELGGMLFSSPINIPAGADQEALATVNAAFFPLFRRFVLSLVSKLTVSPDLQAVTLPAYVKKVNEVIKALHVARRFYCQQLSATDGKRRFNATVKKELLGVMADYVAQSYEKVLRQLGGVGHVRLTDQKINAATYRKGIEVYPWNSPQVPVKLRLFGLSGNAGQSVSIGNVAVNPGPPQKKNSPDINDMAGDGFGFQPTYDPNAGVPEGAQSLTPTGGKNPGTLETIKEKAKENTTIKNGHLWLFIAGAAVAGYVIKSRK